MLNKTAAIPNLKNAILKGEISATVNLAAMGVKDDVKIRNNIMAIFFKRIQLNRNKMGIVAKSEYRNIVATITEITDLPDNYIQKYLQKTANKFNWTIPQSL